MMWSRDQSWTKAIECVAPSLVKWPTRAFVVRYHTLSIPELYFEASIANVKNNDKFDKKLLFTNMFKLYISI